MGKKGDPTTTQTTSMDPATKAYVTGYRGTAQNNYNSAAAGTMNDPQRAAMAAAQQASGAMGYGAQTGTQGLDDFMNPYTSNVVDGVNADFDRQDQMGANAAADQATKAGAFGGDRSAILQAQNSRDVNMNRASTLAGVRQTGYQQSVQNLLQARGMAAGVGQAGMQGLFGLGGQLDANRMGALGAMQQGMTPTSQTNTTQTHTPSNPFGTILGLAGSLIPGIGGLLSHGLGGLGPSTGVGATKDGY